MSLNSTPRFHSLDPDKIAATIDRLSHRIEERFPSSGLGEVCRQLLIVSQHAKERSAEINKPMMVLRIGAAVLIALIVAGLIATVLLVKRPAGAFDLAQFIQLLESA